MNSVSYTKHNQIKFPADIPYEASSSQWEMITSIAVGHFDSLKIDKTFKVCSKPQNVDPKLRVHLFAFICLQKMKLEVVDLQQKSVAIVNNSSIVLKASEIALCFAANSTKWKIIHLRVTFAISESLIFEHNRK